MAQLSVEATYGQALFDAANDTGQLEKIQGDILLMQKLFDETPDFLKFVTMPSIGNEEKKKILREIFQDKLSKETLNFLFILIDKGRIGAFQKIARQYQSLFRAHNACCEGIVYSVEPLNDEQKRKLQEDLSKLLRKKVFLKNEIDLSLLGGIKIQIEGKVLDASLKKKMENLKKGIR